jgi:hypothetical protein
MTTPSSGEFSFLDLATEVGFATPYSMSNFYGLANTAAGGGLMYHNLNMAPGNSSTAKTAIWDNYNAGTDYALSNWYNYSQDIGMVMTYTITNNSAYDVNIDLVLWDSTNVTQGTIFPNGGYNNPVTANTTVGPNTIDTGLLSQNANITSGYRVAVNSVQFSPPPGPGQTFTVALSVASASDTDGVGPNTVRTTYGLGGYSETAGVPPTPYTATKACDNSGNPIPCNKRTTISITIS